MSEHGRSRPTRTQESDFSGRNSDAGFAARVDEVARKAGSVSELARASGISRRMIDRYRSGAEPTRDNLVVFARAVGVSLEWLATGEGPKERADFHWSGPSPMAVEAKSSLQGEGYVALPRYDVRAAAGGGALVEQEQVVDWIYFKQDWLRNTLGLGPQRLAIIEAVGDSMAPSINDGDLLLVDVGEPPLRGDGIYVIAVDDVLLVKRIAITLGGGLVISSDNPQYHATSQEVDRDSLGEVRIIGRVVWVGGRI